MTDPNLRRLLDVSRRRNPDKAVRNHFIIRKRHDSDEIERTLAATGIGTDRDYVRMLVGRAEALDEQDLNNLGLNVIWVKKYSEIPEIIRRLC